MVWVQCMYVLALPFDIDSVDQCHILYSTCSDLRLAKLSDKTQSVINMNSEIEYVAQCASVDFLTEPASKTSVVQST